MRRAETGRDGLFQPEPQLARHLAKHMAALERFDRAYAIANLIGPVDQRHGLFGLKTSENMIVTGKIVGRRAVLIALAVQDARLRQAWLDADGHCRIGITDRQAKNGKDPIRQGELAGDRFRIVADRTDIAGAEAKRFQGDDRVLGGECRIDHAKKKAFDVVETFGRRATLHCNLARSGKIGEPDEQKRGLGDLPLIAGNRI